jgi:DNA-binding NarL/FixJ family response regulator
VAVAASHLSDRPAPCRGTVYVLDRQPFFRRGIRVVLERAGFAVVGETASAADAVAAAGRLQPDLCLVDAGADAATRTIRRICGRAPHARVVVLAERVTPEGLIAVIHAGASGYLPRSTSAPGLRRSLGAVLEGEFAVPRSLLSAVLNELRRDGPHRTALAGRPVALTARESDVLGLAFEGLDSRSIAEELGVSPTTIRRHLSAIGAKLGDRGYAELVRKLGVAA